MAEERVTPWVALPPGEHLDWDEADGPCPTPYMARVTWRIGDGTAVPVGVELRSTHGEPIKAAAWRSVQVGQLIDLTRKFARGWATGLGIVALYQQDSETLARAKATERALASPRKRGAPPKYASDHYRRVAEVYNAATALGDPNPVRAVAKAFAEEFPGVTKPDDYRPKAWVRTARRKHLITDRKDDRG